MTQPRVFVIDPPWPQKKGGLRQVRPKQGRALDYSTLSLEGIFNLLDTTFGLASPVAPEVVFLWAIDKYLHQAEELMVQRGYVLHARLIWDKGNGIAPAFTVRFAHEYLLWMYRRPMLAIDPSMRGKFTTVFHAPSREHSRKPDEAYALIKALYPHAELHDIFSRENRAGWCTWGDETGKFD